jgi:hypothetical protein
MKTALTLFIVLLLFGCSKSSGDTQKPVVVLMTPTGGQQFSAGTVVQITGTVTDNDEIHMVHVIVTDLTHDVEVHHLMYHADAPSYNFDETFTVSAATTYKIHVEADDHVGNDTIIEIQVSGL